VYSQFKSHSFNSSVLVVPRVLEKIPLLLFAGDQDFICNYVGLESMIQALTWNGATGLGVSTTSFWRDNQL
jgi:carboxypeptidase D